MDHREYEDNDYADPRIGKLIDLVERMMTSLEDHQARLKRLESVQTKTEKRVSSVPGDREL